MIHQVTLSQSATMRTLGGPVARGLAGLHVKAVERDSMRHRREAWWKDHLADLLCLREERRDPFRIRQPIPVRAESWRRGDTKDGRRPSRKRAKKPTK